MPETSTGGEATNSKDEGTNIIEEIGYNCGSTGDPDKVEVVRKSFPKLMSTSVRNGEDTVDRTRTSEQVVTPQKARKPTVSSVKTLMKRFVGSSQGNKGRQSGKDGLVKGGLTPTLSRRDQPDDLGDGVKSVLLGNNVRNADSSLSHPGYDRSSSSTNTATSSQMSRPQLQELLPKWEVTPGTLGIYNHGNTCFMNTILQCLSNTDSFAEYFVNKKFKEIFHQKGIAKRIVGSSKGEVTESLGVLLDSIWTGSYTPDVSNHFKNIVSKYNSQYKGSSQHDAQEFLLWLLDRINEEIHHSQKKKALKEGKSKKEKIEVTTTTDSSPQAALSLASGCDVFNQFQALYQSSLTCPSCSKQSNTYESYLCLSLPVPQKMIRPVYITVVYLDDNPKQLTIALEVSVMDTVKDLRDKLAYELEVPPKRLILCQLFEDGFGNTFGNDQAVTDIHESETIYAFETYPKSSMSDSYEEIQILLVHVEKDSQTKPYRFCQPQVILIPRDMAYKEMQKEILKSMGMSISQEVMVQANKLDAIFKIRVMDSGGGNCFLPTDVEWPLFTQAVDRALTVYGNEFGPLHIKFVVEWEARVKKRIVEIDEDIVHEHKSVQHARQNQQQPTHVPLDECLKLFTKEETLGGEDGWQCPHCGQSQKGAMKKLGLWSVPDVLIIHLKRFRQSGLKRNKLNVLVNFPISGLDLNHHVLERKSHDHSTTDTYDLFAVSNHYGNMSGGHYTAFCKNPMDSRWYEYDDTHVKPINSREVVSRAAYLLFYQRKQLENNTLDALHSGKHWIFRLYAPPPRPSSYEEKEDKVHIPVQDAVDGVLRVKLPEVLSNPSDCVQGRTTGKPQVHHDTRVEEFFHQISIEDSESGMNNYQVTSPTPRRKVQGHDQYLPSPGDSRNRQQSGENDNEFSRNMVSANSLDVSKPTRTSYQRTDSVDSSRNSGSFYSSDGAERESPGSSPPSPLGGSNEKQRSHLLNNERPINSNVGNTSSDRLILHANEIHKDSRSNQQLSSSSSKVLNKKTNNTTPKPSQPVQPIRVDMWSTPQQDRKATLSQAEQGRPQQWSTPQPRRRYGLDDSNINGHSRPAMERQISAPSRARPKSAYVTKTQDLMVEGTQITNKPPLPRGNGTRQPNTFIPSSRPLADLSRPLADQMGLDTIQRPSGLNENQKFEQFLNQNAILQSSHRDDYHHDYQPSSLPPSYHQRDYSESVRSDRMQFENGSHFNRHERPSVYATMGRIGRRPHRPPTDIRPLLPPELPQRDYGLIYPSRTHSPSQGSASYNPQAYQDTQRYQPQLYKYYTNLAMREQQTERMQGNYLKESSV